MSLKTIKRAQDLIGLGHLEIPELSPTAKAFVLQMAKAMEQPEGCRIPRGNNIEAVRHQLKTYTKEFRSIAHDFKRHDIRENDRCFAVGDEILFQEWLPEEGRYTGSEVLCRITHITFGGEWGIPQHLCVLSLRLESWALQNEEAVTD
jgi:hypothetical protein